jgi:hypothetical protein
MAVLAQGRSSTRGQAQKLQPPLALPLALLPLLERCLAGEVPVVPQRKRYTGKEKRRKQRDGVRELAS